MSYKDDGNPILVQEHVDKLKTNEHESLSVITNMLGNMGSKTQLRGRQ